MAARRFPALLFVLVALSSASCDPTRYVLRRSGPTLDRAVGVLASYEDPGFARQAAPALLALLEGLLASDPGNPALLATLCRGLYEYAFGFLQQDAERLATGDPAAATRARQRARHHYVRVYELGLRLLRTRGVSLTLQRTPPAELRKLVARLDRRAVPALVWTAVGAGGALQLGIGEPWLMQMRTGVGILLERAHALDPGYASSLPSGALGMYHAVDADSGGSALESKRY
ncbi:MAG: TRAP transporter TatT component family protein, partial [Polyangia bacterium]|nr:TRAP transporter TatT component family protein [Polyangia bacterium]